MRVVQNNYNPQRRVYQVITCSNSICKSVLEITPADIQQDSRQDNYIKCPVCNENIVAGFKTGDYAWTETEK